MGKLTDALQQTQQTANTDATPDAVRASEANAPPSNLPHEVRLSPDNPLGVTERPMRPIVADDEQALGEVLETIERVVDDSARSMTPMEDESAANVAEPMIDGLHDVEAESDDSDPLSMPQSDWVTHHDAAANVDADNGFSDDFQDNYDLLGLPESEIGATMNDHAETPTFAHRLKSIDTDSPSDKEEFFRGDFSSDVGWDDVDARQSEIVESSAPLPRGYDDPLGDESSDRERDRAEESIDDGREEIDLFGEASLASRDTTVDHLVSSQVGSHDENNGSLIDDAAPALDESHQSLLPPEASTDSGRDEAFDPTTMPAETGNSHDLAFDPSVIPGIEPGRVSSITTDDANMNDPVAVANEITGWYEESPAESDKVESSFDVVELDETEQPIIATEFEMAIETALRIPRTREQYQEMWKKIAAGRKASTTFMVGFVTSDTEPHVASVTGHLAYILARDIGSHVLLIDGDLRQRELSNRFGLTRQPGLSNVFANEIHWDEAVVPTSHKGVSVLPAGTRPGGFQEIDPLALSKLANDWKGMFDVILMNIGDAQSACAAPFYVLCDRSYLLIRLGQSSREMADDVVESMLEDGISLKGCIVTNMP